MYGTKLENRTDADNKVIEETIKKLESLSSRGSSVQSGGVFFSNSPPQWNFQAPCHGWVNDLFRRATPPTHVVTSLYYYKIHDDGVPFEETKKMISKWYEDLFSIPSFHSVRDNCLILDEVSNPGRGENKKERYAVIRVTPENIGNLGTFLIMSRHAYEEATTKSINYKNSSSLLTHNLWYHLCYKEEFPFEKILPFASTCIISGNSLCLNGYPHGHSAIDGVPTVYPLVPNKGREDKFGFSRAQYSFFERRDLVKAFNKVLGKNKQEVKHIFGYLLPTSAYNVYNNIKEENKTQGYLELPTKDLKEVGKILLSLHDELYGKGK